MAPSNNSLNCWQDAVFFNKAGLEEIRIVKEKVDEVVCTHFKFYNVEIQRNSIRINYSKSSYNKHMIIYNNDI
jgi:hypothetical protein